MRIGNSFVYGVGVNDADYIVYKSVNGKGVVCQFYSVWSGMLERCYSDKFHKKEASYKDCESCQEWLLFSNFRAWMITQDWQGKELDKDILNPGNKIYSPDNCVFVDKQTNIFTIDRGNDRGEHPIGVHYSVSKGKFIAQCSNPFGLPRHIGNFNCAQEAHLSWKRRKHEFACMLADRQTDKRVADALRTRYL